MATLILAVSLFALIMLMERFVPRAPAPLVAIGAAILASGLFGLQERGVEVIGAVSGQFPVIVMPDLSLARAMWPAAIGIALMSFTETVASARAFAIPGESRPIPNRELLATGASNVAGAFFSAMPAGGGTTQTAVNRQAGARTQVATIVTAGVALATLVVLSPFIGLMPQAALAAIVIAYSIGLVKPAEFIAIRHVRQTEFWWAIIACAGVVLLGTLDGILVAVIASLLSLGQQAYDPEVHVIGRKRGTDIFRPRSAEHPDDESWPGLLILRVEGRAFFLNAQRIGDKMLSAIDEAKPRVVVLDGSAVIDIEYTALKMLDEAEERLQRQGISLWIASLNPEELRLIQRSSLGERLGRARMLFNVQTAVQRYEQQLAEGTRTP
jgi:MFS superfamily sulfate permease-like transporter